MIFLCLHIILASLVGSVPSEHAFYVSVVEIHHTDSDSETTMAIKVFSDDLQAALQNAEELEIPPPIDRLCDKNLVDIERYIQSTTAIQFNHELAEYTMKSCEQVGDTYKLLFSITCPPEWSVITIKANYLMEIFPDQNQMIYVHNQGVKGTMRLTPGSDTDSMEFPN